MSVYALKGHVRGPLFSDQFEISYALLYYIRLKYLLKIYALFPNRNTNILRRQ